MPIDQTPQQHHDGNQGKRGENDPDAAWCIVEDPTRRNYREQRRSGKRELQDAIGAVECSIFIGPASDLAFDSQHNDRKRDKEQRDVDQPRPLALEVVAYLRGVRASRYLAVTSERLRSGRAYLGTPDRRTIPQPEAIDCCALSGSDGTQRVVSALRLLGHASL